MLKLIQSKNFAPRSFPCKKGHHSGDEEAPNWPKQKDNTWRMVQQTLHKFHPIFLQGNTGSFSFFLLIFPIPIWMYSVTHLPSTITDHPCIRSFERSSLSMFLQLETSCMGQLIKPWRVPKLLNFLSRTSQPWVSPTILEEPSWTSLPEKKTSTVGTFLLSISSSPACSPFLPSSKISYKHAGHYHLRNEFVPSNNAMVFLMKLGPKRKALNSFHYLCNHLMLVVLYRNLKRILTNPEPAFTSLHFL